MKLTTIIISFEEIRLKDYYMPVYNVADRLSSTLKYAHV